MQNGWLKLHKKFIDNPVWRHDPTAWRVFEALLAMSREGQWSGGRETLASVCGLKPTTTYKAVKRLQKAKMINIASNNRYSVFNILNWSKYQQSVTASVTTKGQPGNTIIRIENKNTSINTSRTNVLYGDPDINELYDYWTQTVGYEVIAKRKANRQAASNLIKRHGLDGAKKLVRGVAMTSNDRYAPRIADFSQLQSKYNDLVAWGKKRAEITEVI